MRSSILLPSRSSQPNERIGLSTLLKKTSPPVAGQSTEELRGAVGDGERWESERRKFSGQTVLVRVAQNI